MATQNSKAEHDSTIVVRFQFNVPPNSPTYNKMVTHLRNCEPLSNEEIKEVFEHASDVYITEAIQE